MANSDFARKQLQKHGWKEGAGLGKQEHGRAEPIKVSLKMDKTGVGHDPGKEFTDHWWLRVFNEAAQKIGKNKKEKDPSDEKDTRLSKMAEKKKNFYKGFVKSSTLTNGVEEKDEGSESSSEDESNETKGESLPTLDDIHKFCGGATGHRAARFGIKMKGKLSRVAEHDQKFAEKLKKHKTDPGRLRDDSPKVAGLHNVDGDGEDLKGPSESYSRALDQSDVLEDNSEKKKSKKKKKKKGKKSDEGEDVQDIGGDEKGNVENCDENAKEKGSSNREMVDVCITETAVLLDERNGKKKKKRKKERESREECSIDTHKDDRGDVDKDEKDNMDSTIEVENVSAEASDEISGQKKKKRKRKKESTDTLVVTSSIENEISETDGLISNENLDLKKVKSSKKRKCSEESLPTEHLQMKSVEHEHESKKKAKKTSEVEVESATENTVSKKKKRKKDKL